jgi:DNA-binding MarR family transcriptional regulator
VNPRPPSIEATIAGLARVVEVMLETEDLTIQKYRVLSYLAREPASPSELADRLGVRPATVTRLVASLASRRLVGRRVDPSDRRRAEHFLTSSGHAIFRRANAAIARAMNNLGGHMTSTERRHADEGVALWGEAMIKQWYLNDGRSRITGVEPAAERPRRGANPR